MAHVKRAAPDRTDTGRCRDGPGSTFLTNQPIRSRRLGNAHLDVQAGRRGHVDEGVRPEEADLAELPTRRTAAVLARWPGTRELIRPGDALSRALPRSGRWGRDPARLPQRPPLAGGVGGLVVEILTDATRPAPPCCRPHGAAAGPDSDVTESMEAGQRSTLAKALPWPADRAILPQ